MRHLMEVGFLRVLTLSREGRVIRANRGALDLLGFGGEEELLGRDFAEELCAEPAKGRCLVAAALGEEGTPPAELFLRCAGEGLLAAEILGVGFRDAEDQLVEVDLLLRGLGPGMGGEADSPGRVPLPDVVDRLRSGALHDFSNELSVIRVTAELLESRLASGEAPAPEALRPLLEATDRAGRLSSRLLALSRPGEASLLTTDLSSLLLEMSSLLRTAVSEEITLEVRAAPDLPGVLANPRALERIVLLSASSAADAVGGGGAMEVGVESVGLPDGAAGLVAVSVAFQGRGALTPTRPPVTSLDALRTMVWEQGGITEAEWKEGGGRIRIVLPAAKEREAAPQADGAAPEATEARKRRVLLAEDTREVRDALVRVLEREGHAVISAGDGQEALERYLGSTDPIDLVVSDFLMPRMDGVRLLEALRQHGFQGGFVLLSGDIDSRGARLSELPGPMVRLSKPWRVPELTATVRALMGGDPGLP